MNDHEIARFRLRRQHLTGTPLPTPEAVVAWLGAVQAQEFEVAKWSIAQRSRGRVTSADLDRALAEGRILRTHAMRATWHFVLPADLRWLLRLIGPRVRARAETYYRRNGLTDAVFARSHAVLREALAGRQLVRSEIAAAFTRGRVAASGFNFRLLLLQAELDQVICSGALRGKHQTFALVDELVPPSDPLPEDEALTELTRRYLKSHGPATLKDFIWWSSLTAAQARRGLELLRKHGLRALEAGGLTYWMLEASARRATCEAPVHLLQPYDEYIIGYTESRHVLAVGSSSVAVTRAPPRHPNAVIRDGKRIGSWRSVLAASEAIVEAELTTSLDRSTRSALEAEVTRYERFLQRPVGLAVKEKAARVRRARPE